jgi:hypothetical protein
MNVFVGNLGGKSPFCCCPDPTITAKNKTLRQLALPSLHWSPSNPLTDQQLTSSNNAGAVSFKD